MKTVQGKWTCGKCGLSNEAAVIAGWVIRCEFCAEPFHAGPDAPSARAFDDDHRKRGVVARLRERYSEAREFASSVPPPDAESFAHLEWILGKQRNPEHDEATLSVEVSELVVLWLQDLARELESPAFLSGPPVPDSAGASTAGVRQAAADDLRTATRDFAEAFLSPQPAPVGEP
jgi:hypothetical protein